MSMPATNEEWMPIRGTLCEVSSLGRVRGITGRILKPRVHTHGYHRACLGSKREEYVHRLVCAAFHGPAPAPDSHADHINGVRSDNRATNLRWLTPEENRATRNIAKGERSGNSKLTELSVRDILRRSLGHSTDKTLAAEFGMSREQIRDIRLRKMRRHVNA